MHARGLVGTSKDYPAMIKQAYNSLNPGGYLEMTDLYVPLPDFDGSLKGTFLDQWSKRQCEACVKVGVDASAPAKFKGWFEEAGFEDVRETIYKWPIGTWVCFISSFPNTILVPECLQLLSTSADVGVAQR